LVPLPHFTSQTDAAELDGVGRLPRLVPDPLFPQNEATVGPYESRSFWISLSLPPEVSPGPRAAKVQFSLFGDKQKAELPVQLEISPVVIQPRHDFHVIHWWRGEATWDFYKTGMFEDPRWWRITRAQLEDMLAHGSDVVYVPMFFDRRETFKRPCQLLKVSEPTPGKYDFDWSQVKKIHRPLQRNWF
jgi:hypothetical protein